MPFIKDASQKILVGPEGPVDAKICIVGEAPGAVEVRTRRPFTGLAGTLLDKCLNLAEVARTECRITNVVKEQPPSNNISVFIKFNSKGEALVTKEFNDYVEQLYEELRGCSANVFVAAGNIALYALTGRTGIMKWRGSILEGLWKRDTKVIPIIHPAAALRQYIYQYHIVQDLRRIRREAEFPEIKLPARRLKVAPSFSEAVDYLGRCQNLKRVGVDIEVLGNEIACISLAASPADCMSIPFCRGFEDYFNPEQEAEIWILIAAILENADIEKVGQNIFFDMSVIYDKYGITTLNIFDTMVAIGILYPDFPKGLDFICSIYTKEPYYKDDGKRWFRFGGRSEDLWAYNAKDSAVTIESSEPLAAELVRQGNIEEYEKQTKLIHPLLYMHARGIKVDVEGMKEASDRAGSRIEALTNDLHRACGFAINPNSPKQLKEYFYIKKGLKPYVSRKTGTITTDETAMKRLARREVKEASIILKLRHLTKVKGTYLDIKLDPDQRLRCSWNPVGTTTGRPSSSKTIFGTGMNLQNQPEEVRQYLLYDKGYMGYNIDLSQIENRIVAYVFPEPAMIEAFEAGRDMHSQTAGLIFGVPYNEVSDEKGSCPLGGGLFSQRFWGKKANHGLNYDLGSGTFALYYEIPEREARFIIARYHTAYPGIRQGHAWIRAQLAKDRTLTNCFGRKRLFLDRWGDALFKEAYAFIPQSTCAGQINERGVNYVYYNQIDFRPVELLNLVHDSINVQIPLTLDWPIHAEILWKIKTSLESPIHWRGTSFVVPADISMGYNMGKHSKDNLLGLKEVGKSGCTTVGRLADKLREIYNEFRATAPLQDMDRNSSNSIVLEA